MSSSRRALIAFLTGLSGAVMPGPLLALVIGAVSAQGFMAAPAIVAGHALLEIITVLLLLGGLGAAIRRDGFRAWAGVIGGLALMWMGADMLRHANSTALNLGAAQVAQPWWILVLWGAAVSAANPYFVGWWATIGVGQVAHLQLQRKRDYLVFYVGHEASDIVWYCLVAALLVTGRQWLSPAIYRGLIIACGSALVVLSVIFVRAGVLLMRTPAKQPAVL